MEQYFHSLIRGEQRGLWAGMQRGGLWLLSFPYGWTVGLRNKLFDWGWKKSVHAAAPVVSIGNLTVGGTGKTPCVEFVSRRFRQSGARVAILSRGYGSKEGRNDEARVLEENLPDVPHLQGSDRGSLARIAVEELDSEVLVLDDGFQHRRLRRQLDLVLVDALNPWGYGRLLPRGLLRESLSGLRRADAIIITRCNQVGPEQLAEIRERVQRLAPRLPLFESIHEPTELVNAERERAALQALKENPVIAFCGIGNPQAFRQTLVALGANVLAFRAFSDHHQYSREDIDDLRGWIRRQAKECIVVTTQKDLVKIRLTRIGDRPLWALRIVMRLIQGGVLLDRKLKEVLA